MTSLEEWTILFYADEHGREPVREFLRGLVRKAKARFDWSIEQLRVRNVRAALPLARHLDGRLRMSDVLKQIRRIAELKRPLAWITFLLLAVSSFLAKIFPELFYGLVFAFGAALLAVLLEIHRVVVESPQPYYDSLDHAWPKMKAEIEEALTGRAPNIVWLGVTLGDAWPRLYGLLRLRLDPPGLKGLQIELFQASPDFLRPLRPGGEAMAKRAEGVRAEVDALDSRFKEAGANVAVRSYAYMPNLHGLLINGSVVFLSQVRWTRDRLDAAEEPYDRFDVTTELGKRRLKHFESWVQRARSEGEAHM